MRGGATRLAATVRRRLLAAIDSRKRPGGSSVLYLQPMQLETRLQDAIGSLARETVVSPPQSTAVMNAKSTPAQLAGSEPNSLNELVIFHHDQVFIAGMQISDAASLVIELNRKMLAKLVTGILGLELWPGHQARGRVVLARFDPGLLTSSGSDCREVVLSALRDIGRLAIARKVVNSSAMAGGATPEASAALQEAKREIEELSRIRLESGRLLIEVADEWLRAFSRVRERTFTLGIPGGQSVKITIPVHQHVKPARGFMPLQTASCGPIDRPAKIVGRCRLVRTLDGRRFVVPMPEGAVGLQAGSKLRISKDALKKAEKIPIRRVSAYACCGVEP